MRYFALSFLPPLLIFGLYHLTVWFDVFGMQRRVFWKRVGFSSALSHALFSAGYFLLIWVDRTSANALFGGDSGFSAFVLNSREFWQVLLLFDTLAGLAMLGFLALAEYLELGAVWLLPALAVAVGVLGTLQWYLVGGAVGGVLQRVWSGLMTQEGDEPDWL